MSISTREALRRANAGETVGVSFTNWLAWTLWLRQIQTQANIDRYHIEILKGPQGPYVKLTKQK